MITSRGNYIFVETKKESGVGCIKGKVGIEILVQEEARLIREQIFHN